MDKMNRLKFKLFIRRKKEDIAKVFGLIVSIIIIAVSVMYFTYSKFSTSQEFKVAGTIVGRFNTPLTTKLLNSQGGVSTITAKSTPNFSKAAVSQANYDTLPATCTGADCASQANSIVENGLYAAPDDYGTSYYYRGSIDDNNLLFAGYCWKVVRINGDGTTRIIYNGSPTDGVCSSTSANIGSFSYNTNYASNAYVGYMYGNSGATNYNDTHANTNSSTAKTAVDNWYSTQLTAYADYISDTDFCNDRSVNTQANVWATDDSALGYGSTTTYYAAYPRIQTGTAPILTCAQQNDRFTVADKTLGNGALTYPIGLPTADELAMAGAVYAVKNTSFNLYSTKYYWTMTPSYANSSSSIHAFIFRTNNNGDIYTNNVDLTGRVLRPEINLKADTKVAGGTGVISDPYIITNEVIDNTISENTISSWAFNSTTDFHSADYKQKIKTVNFVNNIDLTDAVTLTNGTGSNYWDISSNGNNKVKAWLKTNASDATMYDLYIGSQSASVVANVDSSYMFYEFNKVESINFNGYLDTSNTLSLADMFFDCTSLKTLDLSSLNTTNVTDMLSLLYGCSSLTSVNLTNLDTSNVTNMSFFFDNDTALTSLDLSNFNTAKVKYMSSMFYNCTGLTTLNLSSFNTSKLTNMNSMFYNCSGLTTLDLSNFNTINVTYMGFLFKDCTALTNVNVSSFNTAKVTNMDAMFKNCSALTSLSLTNFNTANVNSMGLMFNNCSKLTLLDVSSFNTAKVTNMSGLFGNCSLLTTLNVSNFDTSNVTNMAVMFYNCKGLKSIDVSKFNTSKVTTLNGTFDYCSSLTSLNVSNFDTANVTDMGYLFYGVSAVTSLDLSNFNTSNVTDMTLMFALDSSLTSLNISSFNTSKVTSMLQMFNSVNKLTTLDLSSFDFTSVTDFTGMLYSTSGVTTAYCKDTASATILNDTTKTSKPTTYSFVVKS